MNESSLSIKVDIDELQSKLSSMQEDDFVTAELTIRSDGYDSEMDINAVGIEEEENISYGSLEPVSEDLF